MFGDSFTSSVVQRALDGVWQRQRAISANIANYETPNYKANMVSFEAELVKEVEKLKDTATTRSEIRAMLPEIRTSQIRVEEDHTTAMRADGNNVDIEAENIDLVKAQLQYMYLTNSMTNMYARLKTAIKGGN